ncbi:hypothetical protein AAFF_G00318360 [Aldrovandia affinis]|uniref:Reverse transcriptase n=1 Tax=Aldrovandia affinis TaxID=143900 RepID=A0AAD7SNA9_9TELE|nr:hypothetical protein AAFF_G00318360 [Aldrovandia affinis]
MSELLRHQDGVVVYMDDIPVYGNTPEEHERRPCTLKTLEDTGLKLNTDCVSPAPEAATSDTESTSMAYPDEVKVKAITQMQPPKDITDLRRILGMIHSLGRYLPKLSEVTKPLKELMKTDVACSSDAAQEEAFRKV